MKHKTWTKIVRVRGRILILRFTVCLERYSLSKTGLWPLGGKFFRYTDNYNRTNLGGLFHAGPFADVRFAVEH